MSVDQFQMVQLGVIVGGFIGQYFAFRATVTVQNANTAENMREFKEALRKLTEKLDLKKDRVDCITDRGVCSDGLHSSIAELKGTLKADTDEIFERLRATEIAVAKQEVKK